MSDAATPWDLVDQAFSKTPEVSAASKMKQAVKDMTPLKGKTALVVDTALATRRAIQEQLSHLGARSVVFASSVNEVEQLLANKEFSLIICEYQLEGDRNGQQLLEELRLGKKLDWQIGFMMVTGERTYSNVVAVAEFSPDDYLIKPFTASILSDRVVRIFNRKMRLAAAHKALYAAEYDDIPEICANLVQTYPMHKQELDRIRIDALILSENFDGAEEELKKLIEVDPRPWMELKLAKIHTEKRRFEEAETLLHKVIESNPEYLAATDLCAEVKWELNKPEEALEVLERLGAKALGSTTRLRKLADLSVRVGDDTRSKNYLTRVIDRSRNSSLSQIGDYLQLSKIYVKEGREQEADKLMARMRSSVNSEDLDLARTMMSIQKEITEGKTQQAIERLQSFFDEYGEQIGEMETETQTSLLEQCFAINMQPKGFEMAREISRKKPNKAVLDRIRNAIANAKNQPAPDEEGEDEEI